MVVNLALLRYCLLISVQQGEIAVQALEATARICETGSASTDGSNTNFEGFQFALDDGNWNGVMYPSGSFTHCQNHFAGLLASALPQAVDSVPTASPKAATAKWSGAGLQFGYEFPEGDRFSLQLHNWKGGDIEVSSQMVVYDYFLSKNLYAGVGSGTIELKALGKTQSQRGSAINLGWQYSFSPSFKLEHRNPRSDSLQSLSNLYSPDCRLLTNQIRHCPHL